MIKNLLVFAWVLSVPVVAGPSAYETRDLSFDERVQVQQAIERVAYSHRENTTRPFEAVYPRPILEQRVRTYLKQSVALEKIWGRPITSAMLRREAERIVRETRMPDRLHELFAVLDDDPLVIQECLARRTLVDRLARTAYAHDDVLHAATLREAESLRADLLAGRVDPYAPHPDRTEVTVVVQGTGPSRGPDSDPSDETLLELDRGSYVQLRERAPREPGRIAALRDRRDDYRVQVVLEEDGDRVTLATYSIGKRPWDDWWQEVAADLDENCVKTVAAANFALPDPRSTSEEDCDPDGTWDTEGMDEYGRRGHHTAVWTGSEVIFWGGMEIPSGERYDPATDTYTPLSRENAPLARSYHTAVWTGSEMIVWGGRDYTDDYNHLQTGGRYDPATDSWTATSLVDAPEARAGHTAVWTGTAMVVWGGGYLNTGGIYSPGTDSWTATETIKAPSKRIRHTAVWTGSQMIIWGGYPEGADVGTGAMLDVEENDWTEVPNHQAPVARSGHTAVWTGTEMIVWGGEDASTEPIHTGGCFNPATGVWTPTSLDSNRPQRRKNHTAVWTGDRMLIWGGELQYTSLQTGSRYNPVSDSWATMSTTNAPSGRIYHTAVWAGTEMIVYGGQSSEGIENLGARYEPASNSWTPMATAGVVDARHSAPVVWTGSEMIVWGGTGGAGPLDTGGLYDPVTHFWTPTGTPNTPEPRSDHTAVWTGERMVVWGGYGESSRLDTGGRYVVALNGWLPTSTAGNPGERTKHTAVWTGTEMIVWGGVINSFDELGGRYDPATNVWSPVSEWEAPTARDSHTAVWTGTEMIVWGGFVGGAPSVSLNTGGHYDSTTDTWSATPLGGAPLGRYNHSVVWTGTEMIVWGGWSSPTGRINTGGRYDPQTRLWSTTSVVDAPSARSRHVAVWADDLMIVWGGYSGDDDPAAHRYDPLHDAWRASGVVGAPIPRTDSVGVWTGNEMVVWFGQMTNQGGHYEPGDDTDCDGSPNPGDCAMLDSTVFATPGEVSGVTYGADKLTLSWDSAVPGAGSSTVHDVTTGALDTLPVGAPTEYCAAWGVDGEETPITTPAPPENLGTWFLVRGRNLCGKGGYGQASDASERDSPGCP